MEFDEKKNLKNSMNEEKKGQSMWTERKLPSNGKRFLKRETVLLQE